MTLKSTDLQSVSDLDSIRNSCSMKNAQHGEPPTPKLVAHLDYLCPYHRLFVLIIISASFQQRDGYSNGGNPTGILT